MLCCNECNIETESALTAVLYIDQLSQQRNNFLQRYAHKHLRNMRLHHNLDFSKGTASNINDKQNLCATSNGPRTTHQSENIKTIRKGPLLYPLQQSEDCETGRFQATPKSSASRKNMESKTTSFGSLASRSSTADFLHKVQIKQLQDQLESLKEQEMRLLRQKLEKDYQYKRQLLKINAMREGLKGRSQERQSQLEELRQLLAKKKSRLGVTE